MIFNMIFPVASRKSQIASITLDVLLNEEIELGGNVTSYNIEDGSEINDHITISNEVLRLVGTVGSAEGYTFGTSYQVLDVIDTLRDLRKSKSLITITTGLTQYTEMAIKNLRFSRSANSGEGNWMEINAEFVKIRKVNLRTAEIPPDQTTDTKSAGKAGKTAAKTNSNATQGKQSGQEAVPENTPTKRSGLRSAELAARRGSLGDVAQKAEQSIRNIFPER